MTAGNRLPIAALLMALPGVLAAQQADVRALLEERGLPADLVEEVTAAAADATAQGLPAGPLADKAMEGWAKHVPASRILPVIHRLRLKLFDAREALSAGGMQDPPGPAIAAAAEAMARTITLEQIRDIVHSAPHAESIAPGLMVAAALSAQGLGTERAVAIVVDAMRRGEAGPQLLDLPSMARAMQAQGMAAGQIGQQMMRGGGPMTGGVPGLGMGARPPGVPPGPPDKQGGHGKSRRP